MATNHTWNGFWPNHFRLVFCANWAHKYTYEERVREKESERERVFPGINPMMDVNNEMIDANLLNKWISILEPFIFISPIKTIYVQITFVHSLEKYILNIGHKKKEIGTIKSGQVIRKHELMFFHRKSSCQIKSMKKGWCAFRFESISIYTKCHKFGTIFVLEHSIGIKKKYRTA